MSEQTKFYAIVPKKWLYSINMHEEQNEARYVYGNIVVQAHRSSLQELVVDYYKIRFLNIHYVSMI